MEFVSVICDECGDVKIFCSNYSETKIEEILGNHPEWYLSIVEIC